MSKEIKNRQVEDSPDFRKQFIELQDKVLELVKKLIGTLALSMSDKPEKINSDKDAAELTLLTNELAEFMKEHGIENDALKPQIKGLITSIHNKFKK